jgi:hypothetical protein
MQLFACDPVARQPWPVEFALMQNSGIVPIRALRSSRRES